MERLYYLSHWLYERKIPFLPRVIMILIRFIYGSFIPCQAKIGEGVFFGHKMGIVISRTSRTGEKARVGTNAVVVADVPPGATVVGIPARIIKNNGLIIH